MSAILPTRRLVVGVVAIAVAAAGFAAFLVYSGEQRIYTASGARFATAVEKVAGGAKTPFSKDQLSPLSTASTALLAKAGDGDPLRAGRFLGASSFGLMLMLLFLTASALVPWYFALAAPLLFALHPQVVQPMAEITPALTATLLLVGPAALLMWAAWSRGWLRGALCVLAGLGAGAGVFAHHLGPYIAVVALMGLAVSGRRKRSPAGLVSLSPVGLETAATMAATIAAFVAATLLFGAKSKQLIDYLFGPLSAAHPPFALLGQTYTAGGDGGPPFWGTAALIFIRTPPLFLVGALAGAAFAVHNASTDRIEPLRTGLFAFAVLFVTSSLSGSPMYLSGISLAPGMAWFLALLFSYGMFCLWRTLRYRLWDGRRREWILFAVLMAVPLLHQGHIAWSHAPYQGAYANVLGGGTADFLAEGNDLFLEPAVDSAGAAELFAATRKAVVVPWGKRAQGLLDRYRRDAGLKRNLKAVDGGPHPTLMLYAPQSDYYRLLRRYCTSAEQLASLEIAYFSIRQLYRFAGEP